MKISIVGTGKLGAPMAALFAVSGHQVTAIDTNAELIESLQRGDCPISETNLAGYLRRGHKNLIFSTDFDLIRDTDITFVIVPTPSEPTGEFSNLYLTSAVTRIGKAIQDKNSLHIVVIVSTIRPGSMRDVVAPLLEKTTEHKIGDGKLGLMYNPEFIALGSVISNMEYPDAILIGEDNKENGDLLGCFYRTIVLNDPSIHRMSWENAEVAKLMLNVAVTTKISLANTFADVCEKIPGGNVDAVTNFIGSDSRIGSKYLKGGTGFGGPCFPRDCRAFSTLADRLGTASWLPRGVDKVNNWEKKRLSNLVLTEISKRPNCRVAILGLAYKPGTPITEESAGMDLLTAIKKSNIPVASVAVYDTLAKIEGASNNMLEVLRRSNVVVMTLPFDISSSVLKSAMGDDPVVIDAWRSIKQKDCEELGIKYIGLGLGMTGSVK